MTYSYTADGVDVYALHSPYLVIYGKSDGAIVTFWAEADSYPEFANRFVLANVGDRISAAYIDDKTEYFYWGDFDRPGGQKAHADYSIVIATDESAYLAYSTSSSSDPENLELGWIEIIVGEDGLLKVGHYQVDGGNGGLFVGSTPEPNGGMLVLVGVFISLLKRPRAVTRAASPTSSTPSRAGAWRRSTANATARRLLRRTCARRRRRSSANAARTSIR